MNAPPPMCLFCERFVGGTRACTAFPAGIPQPILDRTIDHRKPYPGDDGIVFKQSKNVPIAPWPMYRFQRTAV